ncbi:hypothetical protein ACO0KY_04710 [Undibacterium sp. Dicai25W]|uniref:hypothetical protein n=1 Tax=Undibacterium sp. Dicai25W TaxID=3413034 RepID=UPI003BF309B6
MPDESESLASDEVDETGNQKVLFVPDEVDETGNQKMLFVPDESESLALLVKLKRNLKCKPKMV